MGDTNQTWETFIAKGYGQQMIFKKKTYLYHQGETGNGFYYLKKGIVKISLLSKEGSERDIDYVTPGNLLGEQGFNNGPYFTTATITAPSTLYLFSKMEFDRLCGEIPGAA